MKEFVKFTTYTSQKALWVRRSDVVAVIDKSEGDDVRTAVFVGGSTDGDCFYVKESVSDVLLTLEKIKARRNGTED